MYIPQYVSYVKMKKGNNITILKRGKTLWNVSYKSVTKILYQQTCVLYQIPLTFWSQRTFKMSRCEPFKLPKNLQKCRKKCVEVWRKFVHSYLVNYCTLLRCRTSEGQAFIQEPDVPLHLLNLICKHTVTAHFFQLTNKVLTLLALIITCTGVRCGLKYQHWPIKQIPAVD
jgi:hypothetical protein